MTAAIQTNSSASSHILLVNDNKSGLAARKTVLEEIGHTIATATGGEDALEQFARVKFDLVITDYKMRGMDGIELIKRIRELKPETPVIMLSGYVEVLGLNESNTGADLVLPKTANVVAHLIRAVNRLLRRKPMKKPPARHRPALKTKRATL